MSFRIQGLDPAPFAHLYGLSEAELAAHGAERHTATSKPGFPDRIGLHEVEIGDTALLLNYEHLPVDTPYRSRHAIFVREGATDALDVVDQVPESLLARPLSLRAFSADGTMRDADLAEGASIAPLIQRLLADPETAYLHAHYAKHGCYAARITRG